MDKQRLQNKEQESLISVKEDIKRTEESIKGICQQYNLQVDQSNPPIGYQIDRFSHTNNAYYYFKEKASLDRTLKSVLKEQAIAKERTQAYERHQLRKRRSPSPLIKNQVQGPPPAIRLIESEPLGELQPIVFSQTNNKIRNNLSALNQTGYSQQSRKQLYLTEFDKQSRSSLSQDKSKDANKDNKKIEQQKPRLLQKKNQTLEIATKPEKMSFRYPQETMNFNISPNLTKIVSKIERKMNKQKGAQSVMRQRNDHFCLIPQTQSKFPIISIDQEQKSSNNFVKPRQSMISNHIRKLSTGYEELLLTDTESDQPQNLSWAQYKSRFPNQIQSQISNILTTCNEQTHKILPKPSFHFLSQPQSPLQKIDSNLISQQLNIKNILRVTNDLKDLNKYNPQLLKCFYQAQIMSEEHQSQNEAEIANEFKNRKIDEKLFKEIESRKFKKKLRDELVQSKSDLRSQTEDSENEGKVSVLIPYFMNDKGQVSKSKVIKSKQSTPVSAQKIEQAQKSTFALKTSARLQANENDQNHLSSNRSKKSEVSKNNEDSVNDDNESDSNSLQDPFQEEELKNQEDLQNLPQIKIESPSKKMPNVQIEVSDFNPSNDVPSSTQNEMSKLQLKINSPSKSMIFIGDGGLHTTKNNEDLQTPNKLNIKSVSQNANMQMKSRTPAPPKKRQNKFSFQESQKEERYHTEVKQLFAGQGFGELALISHKPRQATIKCIEGCQFATMSKKDYLKILAKIDEKSKEESIHFFQETPFFGHWSRAMIHKLMVSFHLRKVTKDQIIVHEGEKSPFMYMIREGEFEVMKKIKKDLRVDVDYKQFIQKEEVKTQQNEFISKAIGYLSPKEQEISPSKSFEINNENGQQVKKNKMKGSQTNTELVKKNLIPDESYFRRGPPKTGNHPYQNNHTSKIKEHIVRFNFFMNFQFMYLSKGQIFGEESILLSIPSMYSVRCRSAHAEILILNEVEFGRRIKPNEISIKILEQNCDQKAKQIAKALLTENSYLNAKIESKGTFFVYQNDNPTSPIQEQKVNTITKKEIEMEQIQKQYKEEKREEELNQQFQKQIIQQSHRKNNSVADEFKRKQQQKLFDLSNLTTKKIVQQNSLLNKRELDFRFTMSEIVNFYPSCNQQRRIVRKEYHNKVREIKETFQGGVKQETEKDPQLKFQEDLAHTLAKSTNKRELINILKRKLVNAVDSNHQDHLRLLDKFLQSKIVKRYTQAQKKHYISSKVGDALEKAEGFSQLINQAEKIKTSILKEQEISNNNTDREPRIIIRPKTGKTQQQNQINHMRNNSERLDKSSNGQIEFLNEYGLQNQSNLLNKSLIQSGKPSQRYHDNPYKNIHNSSVQQFGDVSIQQIQKYSSGMQSPISQRVGLQQNTKRRFQSHQQSVIGQQSQVKTRLDGGDFSRIFDQNTNANRYMSVASTMKKSSGFVGGQHFRQKSGNLIGSNANRYNGINRSINGMSGQMTAVESRAQGFRENQSFNKSVQNRYNKSIVSQSALNSSYL